MDCKERIRKTIKHEQPDRVPVFLGRVDDLEYWTKSFGVKDEEELREFFGLDLRKVKYSGIFDIEEGKSIWGTADLWDAGYGSVRGGFVLADARTVKDVEKHSWPESGLVDYEELKKRVLLIDNKYPKILTLGFIPVLDTLFDLFGMENAMVHMHESPELIEAALAHIESFQIESMKKAMGTCAGETEYYWCGDDFSTQRGIMISPEAWRRFLKPVYKKMFALIKSFGLQVWFHSCGAFRPVMKDLIDMGMDVWETVQAHLEGNDPGELKKEFGKDITFFGAINCQKVLPFGTPQDVRKEVRERIQILGKGGGYICGPDHSIQKNMPAENLFALYDEARKCLG
ncbi:MAG: hypothetical protein E4H36_09460 [Spirochaetales bacterium]|nr:MAG: hypothetical protein E4H36_09460 [Spirochaetales bacterium]